MHAKWLHGADRPAPADANEAPHTQHTRYMHGNNPGKNTSSKGKGKGDSSTAAQEETVPEFDLDAVEKWVCKPSTDRMHTCAHGHTTACTHVCMGMPQLLR